MKFTFGIDQFTPIDGKPHTFKVLALDVEADTVEEAYEKIKDQIPAGHKMWYWTSNEKLPDEEPQDHP